MKGKVACSESVTCDDDILIYPSICLCSTLSLGNIYRLLYRMPTNLNVNSIYRMLMTMYVYAFAYRDCSNL